MRNVSGISLREMALTIGGSASVPNRDGYARDATTLKPDVR
jgi:hypothetical protein